MWSTSASVTQMIEMSSKERVSSQPRKPYNPYSIYIQFQYMQYYAVPVNMNCSLTVSLFYLAHKNASTKCPFFFGLFKVVTYEMSFSISDCRTSKHSRSFSIFSFYFFFFCSSQWNQFLEDFSFSNWVWQMKEIDWFCQ